MAWSNLNKWWLANDEIGEEIEGQFPAEDVNHDISATYAESTALSRQNAILHFVHGNSETVSFRGLFFADGSTENVYKIFAMLRSWAKVNPDLGRPPVLQFWVGDAHLALRQCVIEGISNIEYGEPRSDGSLRSVSFSIRLREYVAWSLDVENKPPPETRYHTARSRDYYEMLTLREYGDADVGDIIRKRHPDKPNIRVADVIKLPSTAALRKETVEQTSIALKTAYRRAVSPQRTLRLQVFDARNRSYTSHIVLEH